MFPSFSCLPSDLNRLCQSLFKPLHLHLVTPSYPPRPPHNPHFPLAASCQSQRSHKPLAAHLANSNINHVHLLQHSLTYPHAYTRATTHTDRERERKQEQPPERVAPWQAPRSKHRLTWILSEKALCTPKVLPYEWWISLKVIHKHFVQGFRPVNTIDDSRVWGMWRRQSERERLFTRGLFEFSQCRKVGAAALRWCYTLHLYWSQSQDLYYTKTIEKRWNNVKMWCW